MHSPSSSSNGAAPRGQIPEATVQRAARTSIPAWLIAGAIALIALLPRVVGNADFYTTDEAYYWEGRVARFAAALSQADWAATNQTGHPGVTTMWLGALGRWIALQLGAPPPGPGEGAIYLSYLRLPVAAVNALAVGAGYLLLRRLVRPPVACLAALLWALSPFLIAHGRLLHLDALLTSFCTLSLLALLAATQPCGTPGSTRSGSWALLIASGVFAGLGLLTKAPALILPPLAGLILVGAALVPARREGASVGKLRLALRVGEHASTRWMLWMVAALLSCMLLWPALWVDPGGAIGAVVEEITGNAAQPHGSGNFFFGQPVDDPGWSFYPLVILWRGDLLILAGVGALLVLAGLDRATRGSKSQAWPLFRMVSPSERRAAGWLGCYMLVFMLAVTLMPKKFDRYLLPIWPALAVLAAIGLGALMTRRHSGKVRITPLARAGVALACTVLAIGPLVAAHPYYLAAYNPLMGGGAAAQGVLLSGWGDGMDHVGAWIRARPDATDGPTLSWLPATLAPFLPPEMAVYDLDSDTLQLRPNYVVVYSSVALRDRRLAAEAFALQTPPLYTLRIGGATYATVHQAPKPFTHVVGAIFSDIHLRGFRYTEEATTVTIHPSWDIQADRAGGVMAFTHLLDSTGQIVAQVDVPIDGGRFPAYQLGQQFSTPMPVRIPTGLAQGRYRLVLGLYTLPDGTRVPLTVGSALPETIDGPHVVALLELEVSNASRPSSHRTLQSPSSPASTRSACVDLELP